MEEDMISQLPDDILISIITHFLTKEAVRTSILSKRWRNIYKYVPSINLTCHSPREGDSNFEVIFDGLRGLSQLHSGFIRFFKFHFCLSQSYSLAFEESMYSLGKHIEKLDAKFSCKRNKDFIFPCDLLSHMPSLKYLRLRYCVLQPNFSCHCHSLKTLRLSNVEVAPGSLECVLSNCLSLTTLLIKNCDLPMKLGLRGPQLKCIMIDDWRSHVAEIELYAGSLISLEFYSMDSLDILFDYVPQLEHIYLPSFTCIQTPTKDMPHLKSIHLHIDWQFLLHEYIQKDIIFKEGFLFNNIKRLELSLDFYPKYDHDVFSLMPLLHRCPVLQELHLALLEVRRRKRWEESVVVHPELKKVEISGYISELELVSCILRSAVSLEELYVSWFSYKYNGYGLGRWEENTISRVPFEWIIERELGRVRALQPLAASKTVRVMAERFPRRKPKHDIWADSEEPYFG